MTALQELYNWVDVELKLEGYEHKIILAKIAELSKKEKQQIIDAHDKGISRFCQYDPDRHGNQQPTGEEYYNETFKK